MPLVKCRCMAHHLKITEISPVRCYSFSQHEECIGDDENMMWKANDTLVFLESCWVECECGMVREDIHALHL